MAFAFFNAVPLSIGTQIGEPKFFTGDNSTQDFDLGDLPYTSLNNLVQAGNSYYRRSTGGVTQGTGTNMHLSSPPALDIPIIAPPIQIGLIQAFDKAVSGLSNPQDAEIKMFCGDISDIETTAYQAFPLNGGIKIYFENHAPGYGADPSWLKLAPLNDDFTIGSYGSYGSPLILAHDIKGFDSLNGSTSMGDNTITLNDASAFHAGQFVMIDSGDPDHFEIKWVTNVSGNVLTLLDNLAYDHPDSAMVFVNGTGFGVHLHVPNNVGGGIPLLLFNLSINADLEMSSQ